MVFSPHKTEKSHKTDAGLETEKRHQNEKQNFPEKHNIFYVPKVWLAFFTQVGKWLLQNRNLAPATLKHLANLLTTRVARFGREVAELGSDLATFGCKMNISGCHPGAEEKFRYVNFNQDRGCFVVGGRNGYRVFNCDPLRPKEKVHPQSSPSTPEEAKDTSSFLPGETVILAEMLFRCNYVAIVTQEKSRKLRVWDELARQFVSEINVESDIKGIRFRRDKIVAILENEVKVFGFTSNQTCLHSFQTCRNLRGLCSLSPSSSNCLLGYPSRNVGNVVITDLAESEKEPLSITAHESNLSCLTMNIQGTRLATASEKGTLIRLFDTESGQILNELRRGSQPATIYSISFSADSLLLCASSSHGTIHIFACDKKDNPVSTSNTLLANTASNFLQSSSKYLPKYFKLDCRSFARIEIPGGSPSLCGFGTSKNTILALCNDGSYHKFLLDEKGGHSRDVYRMINEVAEMR